MSYVVVLQNRNHALALLLHTVTCVLSDKDYQPTTGTWSVIVSILHEPGLADITATKAFAK